LNPELHAVSLTLRQKQGLYHSLGQLVRSGIPFPAALDKLVHTTRGDARRLIENARRSLAAGHTVGEAFAAMPSVVTPLESAVVSAVEKSGQLERGFAELSYYFGALDQARRSIIARLLYPIFLLHFGILVLNAPTAFLTSGKQFWHDVGTQLFFFYGAVFIVALATPLLRDAGAVNSIVDRLLNWFPVIGKIRRSFALSRFCTVYGMQLDAGINVIDSVIHAGQSSRSGLVRSAVDSAVPEIRTGRAVGPLLAASGAFPMDLTQALIVGEETGSLDDELRRMSAEFREKALSALETFAEWLPRLIYIGVLFFLTWKIITWAQWYYGTIQKLAE
jgi:type II secretory pathway component PulF